MTHKINPVFDILQQLNLQVYWKHLSKYTIKDFTNEYKNGILEDIIDNFDFMKIDDRNNFKKNILQYIEISLKCKL